MTTGTRWVAWTLAAALGITTVVATATEPANAGDDTWIQKRRELRHRRRRIILNNDGCDCLHFPEDLEPTSVNYARPEIRDLAFRYIEEVCQSYDVDGFELDFCRHLSYFPSVAFGGDATDAERGMMTNLLRRVREMAEREGQRRGRPILIATRVPDSAEYCHAVGLDLERWLEDGLGSKPGNTRS